MQNICNLIGSNSVHRSDIFIATVHISMECETQERVLIDLKGVLDFRYYKSFRNLNLMRKSQNIEIDNLMGTCFQK